MTPDAGPSEEREPAIDIGFAPQLSHAGLPVEVVDRRELMARMPDRHLHNLQRARFHQLVICTGGTGTHHVDFTPHRLQRGTVLHIRAGQVQKFEPSPSLDACMVIWPIHHHPPLLRSPSWHPGSRMPTAREFAADDVDRLVRWAGDLRGEQDRFTDSHRDIDLMQTMLSVLLMMIDRRGDDAAEPPELPEPYVRLFEVLEERLFERPSVGALASEIGYSSRTLDRACATVSGQTARQVVDERTGLELRRLLADESRSIAWIRNAFGFDDASNFTKFVRRHLGLSPAEARRATH